MSLAILDQIGSVVLTRVITSIFQRFSKTLVLDLKLNYTKKNYEVEKVKKF